MEQFSYFSNQLILICHQKSGCHHHWSIYLLQYLDFHFSVYELLKDVIQLIIAFKITKFGFLYTFPSCIDSWLCLPFCLEIFFFIFTFLTLLSELSFFFDGTINHIIPAPCFISSWLTTPWPTTSSITCIKQVSFDFVPSRLEGNVPEFRIGTVNIL